MRQSSPKAAAGRGVALLAVAALAAGCASADKASPSRTVASGSGGMAGMMNMGGGSSSGTGSGAMAAAYGGIKPVPTQMLAQFFWQGMRIQAMAMTAVPFVIFNGEQTRMVKPPPNASFHLMVKLSDAQTGVAIPYASVWATITKDGRVVYDARQWPMISRYMGPHYGNNVVLPGAGTYRLSLLISPPVSARHIEYENVWLKPHRVTGTFHWKPVS
jgi:uncharacterized protein involved in high-affinity Fe2+ transport